MASWLRVAEGLLEGVDRRAKLVVSELSDEQSDSKSPASNGHEVGPLRTKSKDKAQLRLSDDKAPIISKTSRKQARRHASSDNVTSDTDKVNLTSESAESHASSDLQLDRNQDGILPTITVSETPSNNMDAHDDSYSKMEDPKPVGDLEAINSSKSGGLTTENLIDGEERADSSISVDVGLEIVDGDQPTDACQSVNLENKDVLLKVDKEGSELEISTHSDSDDAQTKNADAKEESLSEANKQLEAKSDNLPLRVQDQLEEAQGLLKSATSSGLSKEARLARVCAGLSSRLQEYKSENAQLEELLNAERERSNSYQSHLKQLQKDLSSSKNEISKVESNMSEALAAKNSEIDSLVSSIDVMKKQAAASEGKLASLQANIESITRSRELTETRMTQALREELTSAERRAEVERTAHNVTKMAARDREVELEHRAIEASTALARMQRTVDERTLKAAEFEQKLALLEAECASLNQELQDMEARARRGQKRSSEEANQALQAEVQKMRVEMAGMKRDAEHYSRQEHMELEKRYRELTDLLYHKQTQLEAMASEKAAAEFHLEKEMKHLQAVQVEVERNRVSRRASAYWEEDTDLKALEPLPLHHRHMAGAKLQLEKAAKLLDSGAVRVTKFLWRYPIARIILLFYMVFVHFFLMYMLHRLQEQADTYAAAEVAASMGLGNSTLP
ncbi:hypothetical protein GIB67_017272 [Kingdonia uniflora]|uniref:Golgin-84 n=1 Tax=Kingdonia uniflora TaxID=39325 RepID=A0A7J7N3I8_9MAGN|nr:hypothetical protein GIB67_017272 [Kingdonia uniflora]